MAKCENCGAPLPTSSDGFAGSCTFCSAGKPRTVDPVALARHLERDINDIQKFVEGLASTLEDTFGASTEVERTGIFSKKVSQITVTLQDHTYRLECDDGKATAHRARVVRGVTVKNEKLQLHVWLNEVARGLAHEAEQNAEVRDALVRLSGRALPTRSPGTRACPRSLRSDRGPRRPALTPPARPGPKDASAVKRGPTGLRTLALVKADTLSFYEAAVRRAIERIAGTLDGALELDALARAAALSPLHFHHVFRGMVGETPLELHRRLRLERAAFRLLSGDEPVTRIAFDAGYETHEAFTRAFRRAFGASPSGFRASAREGRARPASFEIAAKSGLHFDPEGPTAPRLLFTHGGTLMSIEIREFPARRLAALRHIGPYPRIGETFERLGAIAGPAGLFGAPGVEMIALYHDAPESTPADQLRADAALSVPDGQAVPAGLTEVTLPAGRYACATHLGPYSGLSDTWARFMGEWLPQSGLRVAQGVGFELYRNTPMDSAPEQLRTELYLPIEP